MATVTGLTAARMLAIEAASVVDGAVDMAGHLQLETFGGSIIDAGSVIGPAGPTGAGFGSSVITQTTNLNTITTPGSYVQLVDAWATYALNYPQVSAGGWLSVMGAGTGRLQSYIALHDAQVVEVYYRETYDTGTTWTAWRATPISNDSGASRFVRAGYSENVRLTAMGEIDSYDLRTDITPTTGRTLFLNTNSGGNVYIGKTGVTTRTIELRMPVLALEGLTSVKKIKMSTDTTSDSVVEFADGGQVRQGGSAGGVMLQRAGDTANYIFINDDGAPEARIPAAYSRTTGNAANMYVSTTGTLLRSTSLRTGKVDIQNAPGDWAEKVLALQPRTWIDRYNLDRYSRVLDRELAGEKIDWSGVDVQQINERIPGFVAEEVIEAGLEIFTTKDVDGNVDGLAYDRITAALVATVKIQQEQINELKTLVASLMA